MLTIRRDGSSMPMILLATLFFFCPTAKGSEQDQRIYDVVVYGGTSAGIVAAVQVKRMGGSVIVLEPGNRIGGLTTGGLGQTDIGNKSAIGGISREFYQRIRKHYDVPSNWQWERPESYRSGGQSRTSVDEDTMWTFEPSTALKIMRALVAEHDIRVVHQARLDRTRLKPNSSRVRGVLMDNTRITAIVTEDQKHYRGRCFIDATYEGDLLAGAGVSYTVGREPNSLYDETLNGVQTGRAIHHQFHASVDPYIVPGNPDSGLLAGIAADGPGVEGDGDHRVQAFCFRMCLTDQPANRLDFIKPSAYDPAQYELLFRNFESGAKVLPWSFSLMPNRKTDINNNRGFSTDYIGQSYLYPEATYAERESIVRQHRDYQQGLMWTLANHPRVPESMRQQVSQWGPCRDEFERSDGWQHQLYIREARRMVGNYVMTQNNCQGKATAPHPIGLAAYTMDSHHVQRHVDKNGNVRNEGDVQVGGFSPFPIDYGSLIPNAKECTNLLVPVCLSASHIAFGSIRMEPVFMALAQTAATAAVQSVKAGTSVQEVSFDSLRERLLADNQILIWTGPKRVSMNGIDIKTITGIVADDNAAKLDGFDSISASVGPFVGIGYRHDSDTGKGLQSARFELQVPTNGPYDVQVSWTAHPNRATNVPITVESADQRETVLLNQQKKPQLAGFGSLGTFQLSKGIATVEFKNADTDGYVIIDSVRLLRQPHTP